jgi:hypothetical protein
VQTHVFRPVSIKGFLAQVEQGTQFELKSRAKVLHIFNRTTQDNETYTHYRRAALVNGAAVTAIR